MTELIKIDDLKEIFKHDLDLFLLPKKDYEW